MCRKTSEAPFKKKNPSFSFHRGKAFEIVHLFWESALCDVIKGADPSARLRATPPPPRPGICSTHSDHLVIVRVRTCGRSKKSVASDRKLKPCIYFYAGCCAEDADAVPSCKGFFTLESRMKNNDDEGDLEQLKATAGHVPQRTTFLQDSCRSLFSKQGMVLRGGLLRVYFRFAACESRVAKNPQRRRVRVEALVGKN